MDLERRWRDTARAMSQENVEVIRAAYAAVSRGDWDTAFSAADPELEWVPGPRSPVRGPIRGVEQVRAFLADQQKTVGRWEIEAEEFYESGDQVVVFVRNTVHPRGSDAEFELRIAHLWEVRDGRTLRCRVFPEREKALEAAGLRE
jgi:ketosteroid isomerase-like protein